MQGRLQEKINEVKANDTNRKKIRMQEMFQGAADYEGRQESGSSDMLRKEHDGNRKQAVISV